MKKPVGLVTALVLCSGIFWTAHAATYYVATNGHDSADGWSWATAKQTIQAAIDLAVSNDTVLVSNGVYSTGGRVVRGGITNRVALTSAITVRSVNGPAVTTIEGQGPLSAANAVRCAYVTNGAVLAGFTLTNGYTRNSGNWALDMSGGGAWLDFGGTVSNCVISGNSAHYYGGGVFCNYGGTVQVCTISQNHAAGGDDATAGGGGVLCWRGGAVLDCVVADNRTDADRSGGGINVQQTGTVSRCIISGNFAANGGGAYCKQGGTLENCTLSGNSATTNGGGTYGGTNINCTLAGNSATNNGGGSYASTLNNCIVYSNTAAANPNYYNGTLTYCCTTPFTNNVGNITNDPQFVDAASSNFHLMASSPCIGAGSNAYVQGMTDLDGKWRIIGPRVDMGAYEYDSGNRFVAIASTNSVAPYSTWDTAATNIQDAIDTSFSNGTVLVSNGVYATGGRVVYGAMTNRIAITNAITVRSVNGPAVTIIAGAADPASTNGDAAVRCAYIGANALLSGFTLTNGHTRTTGEAEREQRGGGVWCATNAVVSNCTLSGNSADFGGGSYGGTLNNCMLSGNSASSYGGGSYGGTLNNCTLSGNSATANGGGSSYGTLNNCIVWLNTASAEPNYRGGVIRFCCTTPFTNSVGNISNDPQFVDAANSNFHLKATSPCIDRGNNAYATNLVTDLDGNPRIQQATVDMGAYEFQPMTNYLGWSLQIPSGQTAPEQCGTGDGYPNLLKYATGSNPTNSDELAAMDGMQATNGLFALVFNRNTNASDVSLIVEGANDATNGAPWKGIATNILGSWGGATNVVESGTSTPVVVTVQDTVAPATNRFLRLRVTRP